MKLSSYKNFKNSNKNSKNLSLNNITVGHYLKIFVKFLSSLYEGLKLSTQI